MTNSSNHVDVKDVTFYRGSRKIYDGLNVSFPRGKITAIMGPSGTGKTTLLRMIGGQLKADSGQVLVNGDDVGRMSRADLFELRKNKMGMLFQTSGLFTDLNVFDNVAFPWGMRPSTWARSSAMAAMCLRMSASIEAPSSARISTSRSRASSTAPSRTFDSSSWAASSTWEATTPGSATR